MLLVVPDADIMSRRSEGNPGDVHPAGAGQELVGVFTITEEFDQTLELLRVLRANVGSLAKEVLRPADTTNEGVDARVAEAGVDDDGTDHLSGRFQEHQAAVGHVRHVLHGGFIVRVFSHVEEFVQLKVFTESCVFHSRCA